MYVQKVANDFVQEYYTRLYKNPSTLSELYASETSVVHGSENNKGIQDAAKGESAVKKVLGREKFGKSMVCVTSVSAVGCGPNTISILVMGDMKYGSDPAKMFVQSFVLFYNDKKGPLVVGDILKFPEQEEPIIPEKPATTATAATNTAKTEAEPKQSAKPAETRKEKPAAQNGEAAQSATSPSLSPTRSPSAETKPPAIEKKENSESSETSEKSEKGKKFKFSFNSIAKAPSFRPKNTAPAYPVNYPIGGYSPNYSPIPAYQTMHAPMQVPMSYQMQQHMMHQQNFIPMQGPHAGYREPGHHDQYNMP